MLMRFLCLCLFLFTGIPFALTQKVIDGEVPRDKIVYACPPCGCPHDGKYFESMGQCPSCNMVLYPTILDLERPASPIKRPKVGMFIFNGADIMDVTGPASVFEHAGWQMVTFAQNDAPILIGRQLEIKPDFTFDNLPELDILVFPGGAMAENSPGDPTVVQFIQDRLSATEVMFSVCSGAFFLAEAGVLDGQRATTFASMIPMLKSNYPAAQVVNDVKYTDNGQVVTSGGLSSGIDAAFQVVAKYYGIGRAQDIANRMEYPWKREKDYARSQLADNFMLDIRQVVRLFSKDYFYSQGDHNQWEMRYAVTDKYTLAKILDIISKEIIKKTNWVTQNNGDHFITGIVDHPDLGKGEVKIALIRDDHKGPIAIITAQRVNPLLH